MKFIFLGVNGVLNNNELKKKLSKRGINSDYHYDKKSIDLLKRLINVSDAKVVLLSSVKKSVKDSKEFDMIINKLETKGIYIHKFFTGEIDNPELEISEYLSSFSMVGVSVDSFVILEENDSGLTNYKDNLVLTRSGIDNKDGFKHKHFMKAIKILMGENYLYTEGEE